MLRRALRRRAGGALRRRAGTPPPALLGVALVAVALAGGAWLTGLFDRSELDTVDARFAVRGASEAPEVAVVAIDDATFSELGEQWPFPRSLHARVIDRLRQSGVSQIAYDVQFTEPTKPREDLALYDAAGRGGDVVFSTTEVDSRGRTNVLGGDENLRAIGARAASTNLPTDAGGPSPHFAPGGGAPPSLLGSVNCTS